MFLMRMVLPFLIILSSLTCAGCSVSHDTDELSNRRVSGRRVDENVGEYSLAGFHRDHSPDMKRVLRAEHLAEDPRLVPSAKEQRMARAMVEAEARMIRQGGLTMYRWDGSSSKPNGVDFVASPGALTVQYRAADMLNCVDGQSHALSLVIYHMSDLAALEQLVGHEDGIRKLLEGKRFDSSVKRARVFDIQPGSEGELLFDRPNGGRYVVIVAGYAHPEAETSIYITEYGIGRWSMPGPDLFSYSQEMFTPLPLTVQLSLGQTEMAARNVGKLTGHLQKTRDLLDSQVQHIITAELTGNVP